MVKMKRNTPERFTALSNKIVRDDRLSWKSRGIFLYLFSQSENWEFYEVEVAKHSSDGRDSLRSGLKELEQYGYIKRERTRNDKGQLMNSDWILSDIPMLEYPTQDNATLSNTNLSNTNYKAQSDDMRTSHQNASNEQELKDNFDKLWKIYPNKKDKQRAFKAYKKAVKEGTANKDIQDGIVAYKKYVAQERANGFEKLNYKDGSTFFNGRNWEDEYPVNGSVSSSSQLNSIAGLTAEEQQSGEFMKLVNKFYGRSDFSGNKYTLAVIRKMYAHDRHE